MARSQKFRNVAANGQVALVIDDVASVQPVMAPANRQPASCFERAGSSAAPPAAGLGWMGMVTLDDSDLAAIDGVASPRR